MSALRSIVLLAGLACAGCSSPPPGQGDAPDPGPTSGEPAAEAPAREPAAPAADEPWSDDSEGLSATIVLVANEVAQGRPALAAYAFSSDPEHAYFGAKPLPRGRSQRLTRSDMQGLFARLEERGMFGLPWWDQPAEGPGELRAGLYVWDGGEQLMVLREGLAESERATLYACELELRGLSGHTGWTDPSQGPERTLIYVTRLGTRENSRPAALVFSSDPENPYFQRSSSEQVTVKRYQRAEYAALDAELRALGLGGLPWETVALEGQIGPERALYVQEGGSTRRVLKDALTDVGALKAFSAIERRLIRITMSKQ